MLAEARNPFSLITRGPLIVRDIDVLVEAAHRADVSVNDLTQQCVAIMQPQATRERIIIRTSLPPALPQVLADAIITKLLRVAFLLPAIGGIAWWVARGGASAGGAGSLIR